MAKKSEQIPLDVLEILGDKLTLLQNKIETRDAQYLAGLKGSLTSKRPKFLYDVDLKTNSHMRFRRPDPTMSSLKFLKRYLLQEAENEASLEYERKTSYPDELTERDWEDLDEDMKKNRRKNYLKKKRRIPEYQVKRAAFLKAHTGARKVLARELSKLRRDDKPGTFRRENRLQKWRAMGQSVSPPRDLRKARLKTLRDVAAHFEFLAQMEAHSGKHMNPKRLAKLTENLTMIGAEVSRRTLEQPMTRRDIIAKTAQAVINPKLPAAEGPSKGAKFALRLLTRGRIK